jgi:hypothetical protein
LPLSPHFLSVYNVSAESGTVGLRIIFL